MKVYLLKDVEKVGLAGEILQVGDGFARNYLIPRKFGVEVTSKNATFYEGRVRKVEHRKEVVASKTSMLAEKIKSMQLVLKRKVHDGGKLYGAVSPAEISDLLAGQGISVAKNKIIIDKSIKTKGAYEVTVKLTASLQPKVKVTVVPEAA